MNKNLIIIVGPTGIGKTNVSIQVANHFKTDIISADSRQIFKELKIGTASPSSEELSAAKHYNIATHSIYEYYSAWEFEQDVLKWTDEIFKEKDYAVLTGGSMMYIDAVTKGIDEIPTINEELRQNLQEKYNNEGIETIRRQLKQLDPEFYNIVDLKNHKRVIHAVEICLMTGKPYSSLRTNTSKHRPFHMIKIGLKLNRDEIYERINKRVDVMIESGLIEEAKKYYKDKHLNSLNTVGYKELYAYFDGEYSLDKAIKLIKRNSRRYAKKQLSWFNRDKEINWFSPFEKEKIIEHIQNS